MKNLTRINFELTGSSEEDSYSLSNASSTTTINSNTTSVVSGGGDDDRSVSKTGNLPNGHLANAHPSGNSLISRDALILVPAELESDHVSADSNTDSEAKTTQVTSPFFLYAIFFCSLNCLLLLQPAQ